MNTKFDVGQCVTYPVVHTANGNITGIAISKAGIARYAIGPKWYTEDDLKPATEDKPVVEPGADSKPEPVKLYCVKSYDPGSVFTKGKIYTIGEDGHVEQYDNGNRGVHCVRSLSGLCEEWGCLDGCLFPLVRRPAKVGEWVYIDNARPAGDMTHIHNDVHNGDIHKVTFTDNSGRPTKINSNTWLWEDEYLVLDGYHGDPA